MGNFSVKHVTNMKNAKVGDVIPESDYSLYTSDDQFVQFQYNDEAAVIKPYDVHPGVFTIDKDNTGYHLRNSSFLVDKLLDEYTSTQEITLKIDSFFSRLHIYKKFGIDCPKRGILLYGPPGTGKSCVISKVCNEYAAKQDTVVVIWSTDKWQAHEVKDFIKTFRYNNANKLILVAEDIGGIEIEEYSQSRHSEASLLSLLDNVEKTFTVPTLILTTTNFVGNLLHNLTSRPQRFDDKIEVKAPSPEFRAKFLEFFHGEPVDESLKVKIQKKDFDDLSVAHIKEVVIRSAIYDLTLDESLEQIRKETELAKNYFIKRAKSLGLQ